MLVEIPFLKGTVDFSKHIQGPFQDLNAASRVSDVSYTHDFLEVATLQLPWLRCFHQPKEVHIWCKVGRQSNMAMQQKSPWFWMIFPLKCLIQNGCSWIFPCTAIKSFHHFYVYNKITRLFSPPIFAELQTLGVVCSSRATCRSTSSSSLPDSSRKVARPAPPAQLRQ